jgi:hypothetical protein
MKTLAWLALGIAVSASADPPQRAWHFSKTDPICDKQSLEIDSQGLVYCVDHSHIAHTRVAPSR